MEALTAAEALNNREDLLNPSPPASDILPGRQAPYSPRSRALAAQVSAGAADGLSLELLQKAAVHHLATARGPGCIPL